MHQMNCVHCGESFQCTKDNVFPACHIAKNNLCICFSCWKESFEANNLIIVPLEIDMVTGKKDIFSVKKLVKDMQICYGKETIVLDVM